MDVTHLECPICLERLRYATTTSCGHTFCASCLANQMASHVGRKITCSICRSSVNYLVPSYSVRALVASLPPESDEEAPPVAAAGRDPTAELRQYNQRHANEAAGPVQAAQDAVVLGRSFWRRSSFFKTSVLLVFALTLIYLVVPVDVIPDSVPVVGFLDDFVGVLFSFFFLYWMIMRERERMMRRV